MNAITVLMIFILFGVIICYTRKNGVETFVQDKKFADDFENEVSQFDPALRLELENKEKLLYDYEEITSVLDYVYLDLEKRTKSDKLRHFSVVQFLKTGTERNLTYRLVTLFRKGEILHGGDFYIMSKDGGKTFKTISSQLLFQTDMDKMFENNKNLVPMETKVLSGTSPVDLEYRLKYTWPSSVRIS